MYSVKASLINFDDYFALRNDENNILWSGHKQAPDYEKLKEWYITNTQRIDRIFYLFYENESMKKVIGYLYMDIIGEKNNTIDIGYGVHTALSGKGYGTKIISFVIDFVNQNMPGINYVQGWIAENNIGSIKAFTKNGLIKTSETKYNIFEKTGNKVLFERYLYVIKH